VALLSAAVLLVGACAGEDVPAPVPVPDELPAPGDAAGAGSLVIVLPPADRLAPAERVRVRMLVDRALDEVIVAGPRPTVLEPMTSDVLASAVESAARRAATVCVLGREGRAALDAVLALYRSRVGCLLPVLGEDAEGRLWADVDLDEIGRELGAAARGVAQEGTVLVLDGRDGMLDRRWAAGVLVGAPGAQHVVVTAAELLQLLDDQAAAIAAGVIPGSPEALAGAGGTADFPDREDVPIALVLPPVEVVVLDASVEAAAVVDALLDRGLRIIAPRSLLVDRPDHAGVVLRWRVRWDVPLAALVRRVLDGEAPSDDQDGRTSALADVLALEPGPAAARG
jgi:hypothetical protein